MNARLFVHNCTAIRRIAAAATTTTTARNTIRCFGSTPCDEGGGGGVSSQRRRFQDFTTSLATGGKSFSSSCIFHNNNFSSKYNDNSSLLHGPAGGATLLKGLDIHTVQAEDDGHPLAVYTIQQQAHENNDDVGSRGSGSRSKRTPILLLHGRTWSSLPVYHLIGEATITTSSKGDGELGEAFPREVTDEENRSLLQALYNTQHIQPYAMDFRGFGGTPRTSSLSASTTGSSSSSRISSGSSGGGFVEPLRCVMDAVSVLNWIRRRHHDHGTSEDDKLGASDSEGGGNYSNPALLGWSHGALIAQITAQRHPELVSKLVL